MTGHDTEDFGPYRLEELLGRGGMGEVFRAHDTEHDRDVAVKRLAPHLADEPEFQRRFSREAHHVAQLRNPHVITIHRYGLIQGQLYIDMQLVDGGDLLSLIEHSGALPAERAVYILEQVASALDEAHESGLVHRDVKPSNILLDGKLTDFCYLADWGITRATTNRRSNSLTRTGALLGSLTYMAPEQFDGVVTHASDIYGLTCVFYEMLTGRRPYDGDGLPVLMHAHMKIPPPRPSEIVPDTAAFDEVVGRGMAKDAAARYPTAGALARAARQALHAKIQTASAPIHQVSLATPPNRLGATRQWGTPAPAAFPVRNSSADIPSTLIAGTPPPTGADAPTEPSGAARPTRRRLLLPVLASLAVLAILIGTWGALRSSSAEADTRVDPAPSTAAAPSSAAPATADAGLAVHEAIFTGRTSDGIAIVVAFKNNRAVGYLCDGKTVEAWLEGTLQGDQIRLQGRTPDNSVIATADPRAMHGTVTISGVAHPFSAQAAVTGSAEGLYENKRAVDGIATRIGWIVLYDGSQVGIIKRGDLRSTAPDLDLSTLTATDGAETVTATKLSGESVVLS